MPLTKLAGGALSSLILATSAGATDLSAFGVSLGMTVEEAQAALEERGLGYDARGSEFTQFPFEFLVDGEPVKVTAGDFIGKQAYTLMEGGAPSRPAPQLTNVEIMFFEPDTDQPSVYALRASRMFLDAQVPRNEIENWVAERTGNQDPNCTGGITDTPAGSENLRFFFDAEGNVVGREELCGEYAIRVEPDYLPERDLAVIELGAVEAAEFDIVLDQANPDMVRAIGMRMTDLVSMNEGIEAKRQEMSKEADPLGDM